MKELSLGLWLTAFIFTMSPHGWTRGKNLYPHCTPIAHEIQQAWHEGTVTTEEAGRLIQRCLAAEERGVFIR